MSSDSWQDFQLHLSQGCPTQRTVPSAGVANMSWSAFWTDTCVHTQTTVRAGVMPRIILHPKTFLFVNVRFFSSWGKDLRGSTWFAASCLFSMRWIRGWKVPSYPDLQHYVFHIVATHPCWLMTQPLRDVLSDPVMTLLYHSTCLPV